MTASLKPVGSGGWEIFSPKPELVSSVFLMQSKRKFPNMTSRNVLTISGKKQMRTLLDPNKLKLCILRK